jgi:hypothetical protein
MWTDVFGDSARADTPSKERQPARRSGDDSDGDAVALSLVDMTMEWFSNLYSSRS